MSVFDRVVKILKEMDELKDIKFTPETVFEEIGMDSLSVVEALMACEEEFGVEIDADTGLKTVGEFVALIESRIENK